MHLHEASMYLLELLYDFFFLKDAVLYRQSHWQYASCLTNTFCLLSSREKQRWDDASLYQ